MIAHEEAGPTIENRVQKAVFLCVTQTVCSSIYVSNLFYVLTCRY